MSLEATVLEMEEILEKCSKAFDLIPINALEKGQTWLPSEVAIQLLKIAKNSVNTYAADRWHGSS